MPRCEDANDANSLRHDPIFKLLLDRLPETGAPLASQPTISRCENRVSRTELYRMALVLVEILPPMSAHPSSLCSTCDTEDPVHGAQEQASVRWLLWQLLLSKPLHLYEGLSGRLITTIKAKRFTGAQMLSVLTRLVKRLRHAWPHTLLIVRGASHFAHPEVMQWIEEHPDLSYVTGLTSNRILTALAREVVEEAKRAYERDGGKITRFHSTRYRAGTWSRSPSGDQGRGVRPSNTRFVVTDLEQARTKVLYQQIYCARGQAENEIKDHKLSLKSDRTSCQCFEANQFRLFLHSAAYVLLDTLRREVLKTTPWASATMETIQRRLLKSGSPRAERTDRIKISLPSSCPVAPVLRRSLTLLACVSSSRPSEAPLRASRAQVPRACCKPAGAARTHCAR